MSQDNLYPWQKEQWQRFCDQKKQQRLPHAIIVSGVVGLGKALFANAMSELVLCESDDDVACGSCHSCKLFAAGNHPDHTEIIPEEGVTSIKIEQIRHLKDKQELTPTVALWKTVTVNPADRMTISAFNSLLKLLEEPRDNTLIILVTDKLGSLPITIRSRCQNIKLDAPDVRVTKSWLKQQQLTIDDPTLELLLSLSNGAPLATLAMIEMNLSEKIQELSKDFELLLKGQANPIDMTKHWMQHDLILLFHHLQHIIKTKLLASETELNTLNSKRYWYIYDCIISAIKLTSSPNNINKVLLIEQFMVAIMDERMSSPLAVKA